jgi:nucleotide-binding universal stress UspA family protein
MNTILLCYDGSPDARAAVRVAGSLFDGTTTIVLTVWEDLSEVVTRAGSGLAEASPDFDGIDRAREQAAGELAEEGTSHARASGLPAASSAVRCGVSIPVTILEQAATVGAEMIVLGSRGLGPLESVLMGSVSRAVLQRADRPVLVVPGPRPEIAPGATLARLGSFGLSGTASERDRRCDRHEAVR